MKDLEWDKSLSVDVPEIDQDHRRLLELFNRLGHAVEDGAPRTYVIAVLEELIACTAWHFKHEEYLMESYGYQGLPAHRAEHEDLIASGEALKARFVGQDTPLSMMDLEFLEHWLTAHIYGEDMAMGAFLAEAM